MTSRENGSGSGPSSRSATLVVPAMQPGQHRVARVLDGRDAERLERRAEDGAAGARVGVWRHRRGDPVPLGGEPGGELGPGRADRERRRVAVRGDVRLEGAPARGHRVDRVRLDRLYRQPRDAHPRAADERDAALALVAALRPHLGVAAPRDDLVVVGDQLERHRPGRPRGAVVVDASVVPPRRRSRPSRPVAASTSATIASPVPPTATASPAAAAPEIEIRREVHVHPGRIAEHGPLLAVAVGRRRARHPSTDQEPPEHRQRRQVVGLERRPHRVRPAALHDARAVDAVRPAVRRRART